MLINSQMQITGGEARGKQRGGPLSALNAHSAVHKFKWATLKKYEKIEEKNFTVL